MILSLTETKLFAAAEGMLIVCDGYDELTDSWRDRAGYASAEAIVIFTSRSADFKDKSVRRFAESILNCW